MSTQAPPARFWDEHYSGRDTKAATVNPRLAEIAGPLPPGDALDLGCGAGGDALWLAGRGWRVTAVDIAASAVRSLRQRAGAGVTAICADVGEEFPAGSFDLVSAQYFHTPFALDRAGVLRAAARSLRPGGRLVVVDHGSTAPWSWNQDPDVHYPSPGEVAAALDLDPAEWVVERADSPAREATGPDGRTAQVIDHVLVVRRAGVRRKRDAGPPGTGPGERDVLTGFLDYLRDAVAAKVEGLGEPEVRAPGVPSGTNVLGLVKHLTHVERYWLLGHDVTDWPATFHPGPDETVASVLAGYRQVVAEANAELASWDDLSEPGPRNGKLRRWTLTHLIEETARHAGHADILRELIDGATGR